MAEAILPSFAAIKKGPLLFDPAIWKKKVIWVSKDTLQQGPRHALKRHDKQLFPLDRTNCYGVGPTRP